MYSMFQLRTKVVFGNGCRGRVGQYARELNANRAVVFVDPGVEKSGTVDLVFGSLDECGITYEVFRDVREEPVAADVMAAVTWARRFRPDIVIGMGGGSAIDLGKAVAFIYPNSGSVQEYMAGKEAENPNLPVIAIPTTAGTGSEVSIGAVVIDPDKQWKGGLASPYLAPHYALVDPETLVSVPKSVALNTGLDAFGHAIESFTSKGASLLTDPIALEAISLVYRNLEPFLNGQDRLGHAPALVAASTMAGISFRNTMLTLPHALAHAIGGRYHIPHGVLVGMATVPTLKFNADYCEEKYTRLAPVLGVKADPKNGVPQAVLDWMDRLGFRHRLSDYQVKPDDIPLLAREAMKVTRAIASNPRPLSQDDVMAVLQTML